MKPLLIFGLVLVLGGTVPAQQPSPDEVARGALGHYALRIIGEAENVEVLRLDKEPGEGTACGRRIASRGKDQGNDFALRVQRLLLDGYSALAPKGKRCDAAPAAALRFVKGKEVVEVTFCLECCEARLYANDPKAPGPKETSEFFDAWRPAIVRLLREVLPDSGLAEPAAPLDMNTVKAVGAFGVSVLATAASADAFRVDAKKAPDAASDLAGGFAILAEGGQRGESFACRIASEILTGPLETAAGAPGEFAPEVSFRIRGAEGTAVVLLSFSNRIVRVVSMSPRAPDARSASFSFKAHPERFLELAKQAFPEDADIQALK